MKTLVAIPCLDEEVAIGSVALKARRHATEVVVVDDGSGDKTAEVARLAGATVLRHERNGGKGKAYETLWQHARKGGFDALVVLDGDGQHDADEIPLLLAKLKEGSDLVIGARWGDKTQMPLWRRVGKRVLDYATAAGSAAQGANAKVTDSQSGFRAYSKKALATLTPNEKGFSIESQMLMDAQAAGLALGEVPIHCRYDVDGSTEKPVTHATNVLNEVLVQIGIEHPLLFLGVPGFVAVALGLCFGIYAVWIYSLNGIFAPGWVLLGMTLVLGGIVALFAGLLFNILPRIVRRANA